LAITLQQLLQQFLIQSIVYQIPLRYAQINASAGPVSIKGQAFGLAFYADTRAHSAGLRAMAVPAVVGAGGCIGKGLYEPRERAGSREQRAESREQRAESREQRAEEDLAAGGYAGRVLGEGAL
jgi:hypothetical protein